MNDIQYFVSIKKGDSVQFENKMYRVQDDKGWLHVYPVVNGKRKKVDIKTLFFEPGTEADWAINGWWRLYPEYDLYKSFMSAELSWITEWN
jgi:hypothetical protein